MANRTNNIAADPYIRSIMEDQEIDEMELNLLKNSNTSLKKTISLVTAERDNAWNIVAQKDNALQSALSELNELKRQIGLN